VLCFYLTLYLLISISSKNPAEVLCKMSSQPMLGCQNVLKKHFENNSVAEYESLWIEYEHQQLQYFAFGWLGFFGKDLSFHSCKSENIFNYVSCWFPKHTEDFSETPSSFGDCRTSESPWKCFKTSDELDAKFVVL